MKKRKWMAACGLIVLGLALCSCSTPSQAYADADRATYESIAPEYLAYVEADASMDAIAKQRRRDTVSTWDLRLVELEKATGGGR